MMMRIGRCSTWACGLWLALGLAALRGSGIGEAIPPEHGRGPRRAVPLSQVRVDDSFWSPKLKVYCERTVPHSWTYVRREIEDNEIAAGWRFETRGQDTPWNQANLHKVLETVAYALHEAPSQELDRKLDGIIAAIAAAQQPSGYCNALVTVRRMTPWANLDGQHDGYVAGHLIEAAVAHYLSTGKTNFLQVARRVADHAHDYFVVQGHEGVCGHAELELALVRLYRVTGEPRYLQLAQEWIERRGRPWAYSSPTERSYFMDHLPIREVREITGHAVRSMFFATSVAEVALETGDAGLRQAARRLWNSTTKRKMYVTGAVGSEEKDEGFGPDYHLPNAPGYNESCAACGLAYFAQAMFRLEGRAESVDVLERALYNTVLHGLSLDGTNSYYRNPLTDENRPRNNIWVCCPPCLSRTLLRLPDYVYAQTARDIFVNLYVGSTVRLRLDPGEVRLSQTGDYVQQGRTQVRIHDAPGGRFALRLRRPGWSPRLTVEVNGRPAKGLTEDQGYVVLDRRWRSGDVVDLGFDMSLQRLAAHPMVQADVGRVALQRGPLVYGVEGIDNDGQTDLEIAAAPGFRAAFHPELLGGVTVVRGGTADGRSLVAIPFYALANRGSSRQEVWLRQAGSNVPHRTWGDQLYRPWSGN